MKARFSHIAWFFVAVATLAGCPEKEEDVDEDKTEEEDKKDPEPTSAEPAEPEPTTDLKPEDSAPPVPGVTPAVKAALDGREDGADNKKWTVAGAGASMNTPDTLKQGKTGTFSSAETEDKKAQILASGFTGDATTKLDEMVKAAGLTDCKWGNDESITTGKDKLSATAADGTCKKGDATVRTARIAFTVERLAVLTAWEDGASNDPLFATVRAVEKAKGGSNPIAACCAALQSNAASAPPHQKGAYLAAFGACNALIGNPQGRQALGQVRALLAGANVPAPCM